MPKRKKQPTRAPWSCKKLVSPLLAWFGQNARDLPWRRTADPYAIWVSEIMLQQTQVKTVIAYFERWMDALPDIAALSRASEDTIHKLWEGLGYYTRVRNMQKAARMIVENHGGVFPRKFEDVLALPGIGRYTAGAICSIAFNQPAPIVDGNIVRVLSRIFYLTENPREKSATRLLWELAEEIVSAANSPAHSRNEKRSCSLVNQSLMELGALICTPRSPQCHRCPVARGCLAFQRGCVNQVPNLPPRIQATKRRFAAFVMSNRGRFLVRKRPPEVVNGHLWEFPNTEIGAGLAALRAAAPGALPHASEPCERLCTIRHSITRYRHTLEVMRMVSDVPRQNGSGQWLTLDEMQQLPFAAAHKKILSHLQARGLQSA